MSKQLFIKRDGSLKVEQLAIPNHLHRYRTYIMPARTASWHCHPDMTIGETSVTYEEFARVYGDHNVNGYVVWRQI